MVKDFSVLVVFATMCSFIGGLLVCPFLNFCLGFTLFVFFDAKTGQEIISLYDAYQYFAGYMVTWFIVCLSGTRRIIHKRRFAQ